ncbi:protein of unknown function [Aminobacter niigataensis]|nr:protein of unknown function [Aminobacter niigataensis]
MANVKSNRPHIGLVAMTFRPDDELYYVNVKVKIFHLSAAFAAPYCLFSGVFNSLFVH